MKEFEQNDISQDKEEKYILHTDAFEGPLDLLWDLIKKAKIDITEISLSQITEQYIEYIRLMDTLNIKVAIEFIWMASELLYYKSKSLLPVEDLEDEYFVPPLPPELIEKLLAYKKFQKASLELRNKYDEYADIFIRSNKLEETLGSEDYIEVSLFDLLKSFADVMESHTVTEVEEIVFDEILVSDRIEYITNLLKEQEMVLFTEIFGDRPKRAEIVASFLAILEMSKTGIVKIVQHKLFGDIRILRNYKLQNI